MNKEEFDDVEEIFDFPDELNDEDNLSIQNNDINNDLVEPTYEAPTVEPVEPTYEAPTVEPVEPTYEVPTVEPVEPTYEVPTVEPVEPTYEAPTVEPVESSNFGQSNSVINENPNAQINLRTNDIYDEKPVDNSNTGHVKLTDNKSLMFVFVIGVIILVAIFVLPMLLY